jgi:hypothetical protein
MISIIICGRDKDITPALSNNIQTTIGVEYEIIVIDNSKHTYSIFAAYNKGVALSQYEIVCFMHDDIIFESFDWGSIVINQFKQTNVGAVGVAGSPYYASLPGGWWSGGLICQHISGQKDYTYARPINNGLPVVVVDGLWFCIRKELFMTISFDETRFKGFHYYDVDISLQIQHAGYDILSLYNITIKHSSGKLDSIWLQNALILQEKWAKHLPFSVLKLSTAQVIKIEYGVLAEYLKAMRANGVGPLKIAQFALNQVIKYRFKRLRLVSPFVFTVYALKQVCKKMGLL